MNTTRSLLAFAMMLVSLGSHAFEDGQTIRLVNRGKSVIVKNSSLDANAEAVLWTETNVNSQRWTISEKSNGTFLLQNDYSELFLAGLTSGTSGNVGQASRTATGTKGSLQCRGCGKIQGGHKAGEGV